MMALINGGRMAKPLSPLISFPSAKLQCGGLCGKAFPRLPSLIRYVSRIWCVYFGVVRLYAGELCLRNSLAGLLLPQMAGRCGVSGYI